ncbi:hypothetical protein LN379_24395, partial [Enterobacter hormaechei subsp. steigerwaltii]|nr:hypothetical protein [Enterobacter hormaechei subsp. steigerwaltii]
IEKLNERLDSLKDYRIINRDLVVKDLERLKKRFDTEVINAELSEQLAKINVNLSRSYSEKGYLRLEKATGSENEWWAKIKLSQNDDWQQFEPDGYTIFNSRDHYASLFKAYSDYEIEAKIPLPWSCIQNTSHEFAYYQSLVLFKESKKISLNCVTKALL